MDDRDATHSGKLNDTGFSPPPAGGNLLHNLILFGRLLRGLGMDINPGRMIDVTRALEHVEIGIKSDFYHTLRSLLVHHKDEIPLFDEAFELFWRKPSEDLIEINLGDLITDRREPEPIVTPPAVGEQQEIPPADEDAAEEEDDFQEVIEVTRTYSVKEALYHKDFGNLTPEEVTAIKRLMAQLVWQLGQRKTRRRKHGRGAQLSIRRSLRRNFRYGGEFIERAYREQKIKPRPLVILADISGSMERYTRLLIHFLYSLAEGLDQRVEVFTFSTRLTRITRQLRNRNVDRALEEVSQTVEDWSGGTRIGDALKKFNYDWARRVLRGGAIVLLISDGWDRGEPELLNHEMERLQKLCHRLVWLNPLLGSDEYEPLTRGMQAALPYIDDFLPVHNLASLEQLAGHLSQLGAKRPARRRSLKLSGAAFVGGRGR